MKKNEGVYMNIRQTLLAGITVMFLTTGNAWAHADNDASHKSNWFSRSTLVHFWQHKLGSWHHKIHVWRNKMWLIGDYESKHSYASTVNGGGTGGVTVGGTRGVAPEIDAASGTSAIALLTGVLLLAGERVRPRRV
jgi:hypothetical protein